MITPSTLSTSARPMMGADILPLLQQGKQLAQLLPPLLLQAQKLAASVMTGGHGRRRSGRGEDFWEMREYVQGDSIQKIDWIFSAKSDKLYVREKEWKMPQLRSIWLDVSPSMLYRSDSGLPSKIHTGFIMGLALASLMIRAEETVSPLTNVRHKGRSQGSLLRLAQFMANDTCQKPADVNKRLKSMPLPLGSHGILISDFLSDPAEWLAVLKTFEERRSTATLIHILDPLEENLNFKGYTEILTSEDASTQRLNRAEDIRQSYKDRYAAHYGIFEDFCRRRKGWGFHTISTSQPQTLALMGLYQALNQTMTG